MPHTIRLTIALLLLSGAVWAMPAFYEGGPVGLFGRSSAQDLSEDCGVGSIEDVIDLPFVDGIKFFFRWSEIEPVEGEYLYLSCFETMFQLVQSRNKGISVNMTAGPEGEPTWLALKPGAVTWFDDGASPPANRLVPWDQHWAAATRAVNRTIANLPILDSSSGQTVPLYRHPSLVAVRAYVPPAGRIRNPGGGLTMADLSGYSRDLYTTAVLKDVRAVMEEFHLDPPHRTVAAIDTSAYQSRRRLSSRPSVARQAPRRVSVRFGFWDVNDATPNPALWEHLDTAVSAIYDGAHHPRVGYGQDNLSANRPTPLGTPVDCGPLSTGLASTLVGHQPLDIEPLASWTSQDNEKLMNSNPGDGFACWYSFFGGRHVNVYNQDLENGDYATALQAWHDFWNRTGPQPTLPPLVE